MLLRYLLSSSSNVLTTSSQTSLYVWGKNGEGQLGDGTTVNKSQPVSISNFIIIITTELNSYTNDNTVTVM